MIKAYWDGLDENTKIHYEQMVEESLSNENIHTAVPFIHSNGKLSYVATIFVPAGGGIYQDIYDFETNEPLSYFVCSADHSAEPSVSVEENDTDSSVSAQTPAQALEAYSTVLDMFYSSIACNWTNCDGSGWGIADDPDDACYIFPHYLSDYALNEIGFAFIDLNYDGTLELIIAPMDLTAKGEFYDLYTVSNGKVIHSASAGERDRFFLAVNGSINNHASGGAVTNVTSNKYLDPKDGQLKINQAVIYDEYIDQESPWFHSTEEYYNNKVYDYYYDSLKPVSEEEAIHIKDAFPGSAALELTAFEEYGT